MEEKTATKSNTEKLFTIIEAFIDKYGYSPTHRELCEFFGITSTGHMDYLLDRLKKLGRITFEERKSRTIRIVKPAGEVA